MNPSEVRVLIVDDEGPVRRSLAEYLDDLEFHGVTAGNAEDALRILSKQSFHIVIVDLRLPGIGGETFILNACHLYPHLQFIIHTGSVGYTLSKDLIEIGMQQEHVLHKPVHDLMVFAETIQEMVSVIETNILRDQSFQVF